MTIYPQDFLGLVWFGLVWFGSPQRRYVDGISLVQLGSSCQSVQKCLDKLKRFDF